MGSTRCQTVTVLLALILSPLATCAHAEDIDIFSTRSSGGATTANIMIVLDNTSNWSSHSQGWPNGITQGQAEVQSLSKLVNNLVGNTSVNLGLMVLTGVSGNPGGAVVFNPAPITGQTAIAWNSWLSARNLTITDPNWKASSNANYGAVMFDVFKFFGGYTSPAHATDNVAGMPADSTHFGPRRYASINAALVDPNAYTPDFSTYRPPLATDCIKNYIIFIGNGFPNADDPSLLTNVNGDTTPILPNPMDGGSKQYLGDEWARFLAATDVSSFAGKQPVITYTLNVFGPAKFDPLQAQYLANMASKGGGKYFTASSDAEIVNNLQQALIEIQAVNDTFSSASLPVNTANRSQNKNQVFIPMFRPDEKAQPRWLGNLKQYQFIDVGGLTMLGDSTGLQAINPLTGFITDCATSFWTSDSNAYWSFSPQSATKCPTTAPAKIYSDAPDGPLVEKGGVAEVLRKGNNPPTTDTNPSYAVNRNLYTIKYQGASAQTGSLATFNVASSGLSQSLVDFISGKDTQDENGNNNFTESRASIHGDVIHSRPLAIDYGGTTGVSVFYGANDGTFRAVDSTTGRERWALIAPEFFSGTRLQRLQTNSPLISSFTAGITTPITPTPTPKDYFFDGAIGVYQNANNTKVWIYPTTRRGGRMVYGMNVTAVDAPEFSWRFGCASLTDDKTCTAGASGIGQTWSKPLAVEKIAGYPGPVVIFGGGYDTCEDANMPTLLLCNSEKGAIVYVLDAFTGTLIKSFATPRAAVADIALLSSLSNGIVDTAYVADTGGNISRIDFKSTVTAWSINTIAYTHLFGRKFLYAPALLQAPGGKVYLAIGSGDREHPLITHYPYLSVLNRFYVLVDNLASTTAVNLDDTVSLSDYSTVNSCTNADVLPGSSVRGYFVNLNAGGIGEQTVTSALIVSGMVSFSTNRPVAAASGTCSASLGEARGYWLNLFNGAGAIGVAGSCGGNRSSIFAGGGLPPSPVIGVVPVNGQLRTVVLGAAQRDGSASTPISPQEIKPLIRSKRKTIYWKSSGMN